MSITYRDGDIFASTCQTIVNPINTRGVMGAGLAILFKQKYPGLFADYYNKCKAGLVKIGEPYVFDIDDKKILNFPTKDKWEDLSKMEYIASGLQYFRDNYVRFDIKSIAFPCLGAGLGGLDPRKVFKIMEKYLGDLTIDIEFYNYKRK